MRTRWWRLGLLVAMLGVAACGGGDGGDTADGTLDTMTPPSDTTVGTDAAPDAPDGPEDAVDAPPEVGGDTVDFGTCAFRGRVLDQAGQPIQKVSIVICGEDASKCIKATTKADGTWSAGGTARAALGAKVLGGPSGHTSVSLPLAPCTTPEVDVGDVTLFTPDAGAPYDGVTSDWLQAHPALALQLPPGVETQMYETAFTLQAAAVDLSRLHPLLAAQITPVAAFALTPYYATSPAPVPYRATLPLASTTVDVYVLDYLTGQFQVLGDAPVDADGVVTAPADAGLPQLTWVAFVAR